MSKVNLVAARVRMLEQRIGIVEDNLARQGSDLSLELDAVAALGHAAAERRVGDASCRIPDTGSTSHYFASMATQWDMGTAPHAVHPTPPSSSERVGVGGPAVCVDYDSLLFKLDFGDVLGNASGTSLVEPSQRAVSVVAPLDGVVVSSGGVRDAATQTCCSAPPSHALINTLGWEETLGSISLFACNAAAAV